MNPVENPDALGVIAAMPPKLLAQGVRYCHWKSNWALGDSVRGDADLDILVHRDDARRFRAAITELGFAPVVDATNRPFPAVEHFYALDDETSEVAHVHAYYRIITGQSLTKNYILPVEEMLLSNTDVGEASLRVPDKAAELVVFVIRMLIKHTSPLELALLLRQWKKVKIEVEWLLSGTSVESAAALLPSTLPQLDRKTFERGVDALRMPASLPERVALGFTLRRKLRTYARHRAGSVLAVEAAKFSELLFHRARGSKKGLTPSTGGALIAFVGSEASGKSTLLDAVSAWLGKTHTVDRIHAGKPPGTALTFIPNRFVPLMRTLAPSGRSSVREVSTDEGSDPEPVSLVFAVRSVSLAYDRRAVLLKARARAAGGRVVLCDRYPGPPGQVDGPQLSQVVDDEKGGLLVWLAKLEARLYADIPRPDLVVFLNAPLSTTLARNAARDKTEPEDYVRRRHARSQAMRFDGAPIVRIDTDQPLESTFAEVKRAVYGVF